MQAQTERSLMRSVANPYQGLTVTVKRTVPDPPGANVPTKLHSMPPMAPAAGALLTLQLLRFAGSVPMQAALAKVVNAGVLSLMRNVDSAPLALLV